MLHEKLRDQNFGKLTEERPYQKIVRKDDKKLLYPRLDAVKPKAP